MIRKTTAAGILLLAFCFACRLCTPVADCYAFHIYPVVSMGLSSIASVVPFSLEEIVVLGFLGGFVCVLVKAIKNKE